LTNFGLQTHLDLLPAASDLGTFNAILDCAPYNSVETGISKSSRAAIRLVALGKNQYARMLSHRIFDVLASDLAVPSQETYRQVFIKQQPALLLPDIALQGLEIISSHKGSLTHVWPQGQWDPINKMVRPRGTQRDGTLAGFRFEFHKATPKRVFLDIFVNYSMAAESSTLWTAWVSHLESDDSVQLTDVIPEAQKDVLESTIRDLSFVYNIDSHPSIVFLIDRQYEQGQPLLTLKIDQIHELPQANKDKSFLKRSKSPTNPLSDSSDPLVMKVEQIARPMTVDDSGSVSLCKLSSSFREIRTSRTDGLVDCRQSLIDIRYQVTTQLTDLVVLTPGQSTPTTFEAYFSTLLIKACIGNDTLGVEELIKSRLSTAFVDSWTSEVRTSAKEFDPLDILSGFRPVHWATLYGHLDIVSILLSHGADAFPETSIGFTPAHIAIVMGHMEIFQRLFVALPASQRWSPQDRPHACDTLPNFAATYVRSEQATSVLETLSTNMDSDGSMSTLNTLNVLGETPLHRASASNNVFAASWLVQQQRALVHRRDRSGRTPLFHAAAAGSPEICQLLLDVGADTNTRDELDRTPLHAACRHGHHAVVKLLLDAEEASVYTDWNRLQSLKFNAWHFATLSLNPEVLRCLLLYANKSNATNTKVAEMNNEAFINPINIASWVGDLDCVKILCEAGFSTVTRTRWQIVPTTTGYGGLSVKISGAAYTAQEWAYQIGNYRVTRFLRDAERQETTNMVMDRVAK
jgi:ankyrin repeat protein